MPANFYNAGGSMVGVDYHDYIGFVIPAIPIPAKALYGVYAAFDGPCADEATRLAKVTSSAKPTLQGGFKRQYIVHVPGLSIPIGLLPHPLEAPLMAMLYAFSGSTALLKKATVSGGGKPLAVCIHGAGGMNLNCADPFDMPSDFVYNESSVMTEPSIGDFVEAAVSAAISAIISVFMGKVSDKLFGKLLGDKALDPSKLLDPVRKYIEGKIKDQIEEWVNEPATERARDTLTELGFTKV